MKCNKGSTIINKKAIFYLMEDRVMRGIDFISSVDVAHTQERRNPLLDELTLVRRGVGTQYLAYSVVLVKQDSYKRSVRFEVLGTQEMTTSRTFHYSSHTTVLPCLH